MSRILAKLMFSLMLAISMTGLSLADGAAGTWRGSWSSAETGHRGPLRAVIRPTPTGSYRAFFVGRFAGVVPFAYRAELYPAAGLPGYYTSVKRLPLLGEYNMQATVSDNAFHATFRGGRDTGIFQMVRRK